MPQQVRVERPSRSRRLLPVLALLFLAPWAAECSWGGFTLADMPLVVVVLAPMYGGAAVLIREAARRTGGGWPAIVLLAAAFGVVQAGLVDQSLFNSDHLADTEFADAREMAESTMVPGLGFSAQQALSFIGGHVLLSICAPIAIIESYLGGDRRHRPWLGVPGLAVVGVLYLLGSALIFADDSGRKGFLASPGQLAFAAVLALLLIGAALLTGRWSGRRPQAGADPETGRAAEAGPTLEAGPAPEAGLAPHPDARRVSRPEPARAPRPVWGALAVLPAYLTPNLVPGWLGIGVAVAVSVAGGLAVLAWSRREGWGQRHVLATGTAGLLVAAAGVYTVPNYAPASPAAALVGDIAVGVIALALVGGAYWRLRREPSARRAGVDKEPFLYRRR